MLWNDNICYQFGERELEVGSWEFIKPEIGLTKAAIARKHDIVIIPCSQAHFVQPTTINIAEWSAFANIFNNINYSL